MKTFILRSPQVKSNCLQYITYLNEIVEVRIGKPKRSNQANAYWHSLLDILAKETGEHPEELKLKIKYQVLPLREVHVNGQTYMYPVSSADLNKADFSKLIEATMMMGSFLNIQLPSPKMLGFEI